MKEGHCLNPQTGRIIKKSTAQYRKLVKLGLIEEEPPNATPEPFKEPFKEPEPVPEPISVKTEMAKVAVDLVKKNEAQFVDLSKKETDKLLRQLLIERLCPKQDKKKKKSKYKLKAPPPSSDESSDSD
jgi:hypothetical protein